MYFDIDCKVHFVSEQLNLGEKKAVCVKEMTVYVTVTWILDFRPAHEVPSVASRVANLSMTQGPLVPGQGHLSRS